MMKAILASYGHIQQEIVVLLNPNKARDHF